MSPLTREAENRRKELQRQATERTAHDTDQEWFLVASPSRPRPCVLDEEAFPNFGPLLVASQEYAENSGSRFILSHFGGVLGEDGVPVVTRAPVGPGRRTVRVVGPARGDDPGPLIAAKLRVAQVLPEFTARLRAGDVVLLGELEEAMRVVTVESVRCAMLTTFQALDMWPPSPPPSVDAWDTAYWDLTVPLPVIAQRTYNDHLKRLTDLAGTRERVKRRACTASYLLDLVKETNAAPPAESSGDEERHLAEFFKLAEQWEVGGATGPGAPKRRPSDAGPANSVRNSGPAEQTRKLEKQRSLGDLFSQRRTELITTSKRMLGDAFAGVSAASIGL